MVLNRIGLTGATGMLGRHVRAALEAAGAQIVATSRASLPASNILSWDLAHWLALEELDSLFGQVQAVVHVGAIVPKRSGIIDEAKMFDANVRSCVNLCQWAISRNVPIVQVSGAIVYAECDRQNQNEEAALGWNGQGGFYGFSKLLAEDVFKRFAQRGLRLAVLRPSSIYGYGLPADKMISRFLATANMGNTIELAQPVNEKVDVIHAADVSRAILAILQKEVWDIFNIASGRPVSIKDLAEACILVAGRGSILIKEDELQRSDPITRFSLDSGRANRLLGWQPRLDLSDGLRMMLQERVYPVFND